MIKDLNSHFAFELYEYGKELCHQGRYSEAKEQLLLSDELEHYYETYYRLYLTCKGLMQDEEAMKYLKLCYEENCISKNIALCYAKELFSHGRNAEAINVLEYTLHINDYDEDVSELLHEIRNVTNL